MNRLIPGKTKVQVELFRGVTVGDVAVALVGAAMLILVVISSLPHKLGICTTVVSIAALLLVRIDERANYVYLLGIFVHFAYDRRFGRLYTDEMLTARANGTADEASFNELFWGAERPGETVKERKARLKAEKASAKAKKKERAKEDKLLKSKKTPEDVRRTILEKRAEEDGKTAKGAPAGPDPAPEKETRAERRKRRREEKAAAKAEEKERRREDKILKSKTAGEEEKEAIRKRRREEAERELREDISRTVAEGIEAERKGTNHARKAKERARAKLRREEERILKSKTASESEKQAIRDRRAKESAEAMRALAEAKEASANRKPMGGIIAFTGIRDGYIEYGKQYFGGVLEIAPVEFRFFSEGRRRNSIENCMGRILRSLHGKYCANIVKLERPVMYDDFLRREREKLTQLTRSFESGMLTEDEYKIRVEIEYDRINELENLCYGDKIVDSFYYLALFESDRRQLDMLLRDAESSLRQGELSVRRLDTKELAVFLKYSNALDFDEREIENIREEDYAQWAMPQTVDIRARRVEINHIVTHNFRVVNYPSVVGDAWLAGVMSMPATKVVVKARQMDREKAVKGIDRSLVELRGQWSATGIDSKRLEIEEHLNTLQELLTTLQGDNEVLLECNVYVTAYDIAATRNNLRIPQPPRSYLTNIADMKKNVRRAWQEQRFRLNNMEFSQTEAFIGSQISAYDPRSKQGRGIPGNTVAACFPWIFAHISDPGGILLGESAGVPVFINFFRRDSERVNSNMVIVGKSGSGKSYATKSLLLNLAAEDAKIFILDPENEYTELAHNLHGKFINVGNAQFGRLNPFHIITALDDDETEGGGAGGSYATHLQFLEEFFRQILPDCDKDALEYLNTMVDRVYSDRGILPETDLSALAPEDYPVFDDLYETIVEEFQHMDNQYLRTMLRTLMNYVAKFSTGGRNANIWNGPSTVTTDENFTVFNFQSMLANRNTTIANAQMLLVLKYIDNEIIKNRDYNTKYGLSRKVVVVIDEAHVFIDTKFPIALDFMFQLAKRIRKYNGMQIVITQNIKDFVGSEEIARKSTAIINACQYSFVFALAPNDIQDLVKLYEKAGGINESEQEQITQAPRGQAFTIMSPTSRSTFRVDTPASMTRLFERRDRESRYFGDDEGARVWEAFVEESRRVRAANAGGEKREGRHAAADADLGGFLLEEISGEEYDQERAKDAAFLFEETAEADRSERAAARHWDVASTLAADAPAFGGAAGIQALDRLTEAIGQFSMDAVRSEVYRAVDERMLGASGDPSASRLLDELSELRRRNEELERRLRGGAVAKPAEEPEKTEETGSAWESIWGGGETAEPEKPEKPKKTEETGGAWTDLWGGSETAEETAEETASSAWTDIWGQGESEEAAAPAQESGSFWSNAWSDAWDEPGSASDDENGVRLSWGDYAPGASGAGEEDDDIFSRSARLVEGLGIFDRMLASGLTVMDITMDDLVKQLSKRKSA